MARMAQYGPAPVPDVNGVPISAAAVTVTLVSTGGPAALTTDISGSTGTGSNVATADSNGLLTFCAPSGTYVLSWAQGNATATSTVTIQSLLADPAEYVSDDATKGVVLKDANGHYWRVTVSTSGVLVTADLGTTRPSA